MKKIMLVAVMVMFYLSIFSQSPTDSIKAKFMYCEIVGTGSLFSTKVKIEIDYGQEVSFWNQANGRTLKDETGNSIKFNSMVDALNFMGTKGWEFVQAYNVLKSNQDVYHWLLKQEIKK